MMRELRALEASVRHWGEPWLTLGCLIAALVLVVIALEGPSTLKAAALAYCIFP